MSVYSDLEFSGATQGQTIPFTANFSVTQTESVYVTVEGVVTANGVVASHLRVTLFDTSDMGLHDYLADNITDESGFYRIGVVIPRTGNIMLSVETAQGTLTATKGLTINGAVANQIIPFSGVNLNLVPPEMPQPTPNIAIVLLGIGGIAVLGAIILLMKGRIKT